MPIPAFDEPLIVSAVDGEVAVTGPDGLCAAFTVQAARESASRLLAAADSLEGLGPSGDKENYQKPLG